MSLLRRLTVLAVAVLLALGAAACGDDDEDNGGSGDSGQAAQTTGDGGASGSGSDGGTGGPVTIVASVPPTDHGWLGAISKNAKAAAERYDDVRFRLLEAADADS